jgi:hypothetical protein
MRGQNMTDARARDAQKTNNDLRDLKAQELQMQMNQQRGALAGSIDSYDRAIGSLDALYSVDAKTGKEKQHPGLSTAVGIKNPFVVNPFSGKAVPGTDAADFQAQLDTLKAQTFLPMVQSLRGMGALSDAEGKKLTDAIGALNTDMSETAFKKSVLQIRQNLEKAKNRAQMLQQLNGPVQQPAPQADGGLQIIRDANGRITGIK